ncbi:hypothetical protein ACFFYR_32860 [Paraburkholderia dipogonis]|uniref:hypothetical protein n=1 Tax=Paraburkholderia dipogonis TaxID=1211383 RepID=UPI0035EE5807
MTQPTQPHARACATNPPRRTRANTGACSHAGLPRRLTRRRPRANTDGIWYASYPAGRAPREIDVSKYESVVQFFDECIGAVSASVSRM